MSTAAVVFTVMAVTGFAACGYLIASAIADVIHNGDKRVAASALAGIDNEYAQLCASARES